MSEENNVGKSGMRKYTLTFIGAIIIGAGIFFIIEAFRDGFVSPQESDVALLSAIGMPILLVGVVMFIKNSLEFFKKIPIEKEKNNSGKIVLLIIGAIIVGAGILFITDAYRLGFTAPVDNDAAPIAAIGISIILLGAVMFLKNVLEIFRKKRL